MFDDKTQALEQQSEVVFSNAVKFPNRDFLFSLAEQQFSEVLKARQKFFNINPSSSNQEG